MQISHSPPSATKYGLTPKQAECLAFIREYIAQHGHSPSYDEIALALNLASKSGVFRLIKALERRGYLRRMSGIGRSIALTKQGGSHGKA